MPKYSANLASPFTIGQLADQYKTAFDTLGWGTGKVSIQGGYRFTAQQSSDTSSAPIAILPDGSVTAPSSITNITGADWVDNFAGKVYVYPGTDGRHRWPLLFYLPGLKAFRITFTPVYRADGASTGPFSDIEVHVMESVISTNPTDVSRSNRAASMADPAWGSSYTVGQSYTTIWSHPDALSGDAEIATYALFYAKNVVLRIDKIEYIVTPEAFGVQGPNLDGPLFEFRFLDGAGYAYGAMRPLPVKDAYRPRILLLPPHLARDTSVSSLADWRPTQLFGALFNAYREDDLQQVGLANREIPTYAVVKHYSYGADLNVLLASNADHRGFMLRSAQSGSTTIHVLADRVDKSVFPATPTTIPERRERVRWLETDYAGYSTYVRGPTHIGVLVKVEGQNRTLQNGGVSMVYGVYSNTYTFKLYRVTKNASGELVYDAKVADIPMVGNGASGTGYVSFSDLGLDLAPGYYLLVPPSNLRTFNVRGVPTTRSTLGSGVRLLGPVVCRDLSDDTAWVAGSTVLNVTGSDFSIAPNNAAVHASLSLWLEFDVGDTPTSGVSAFGEGLAIVTHSPGDSSPNPARYDTLPTENTENSSNGKWVYGNLLPLGVDRAISGVEAGAVWQLSPLPGWWSGTQARYTTAQDAPTLEFEPDVAGRFPAWLDRPYRFSLPLERTVLRPMRDVAPGNSYANDDGSEDLVAFISRADSSRPWSVCFHTEP